MEKLDVIVLGAGAAGLFCGIEAARRGRRVRVIDHARAPGEKIRISGGGRCNFTNLEILPDRFLSRNPRFALSALKRFTQWDFIARMDGWGIPWHEKTLGQLFCDGPATQVVDALTRDLSRAGGDLWLGGEVGAIGTLPGGGFSVETPRGVLHCASLVVATGGKSIPKMGASGFGYRVAEQFGLPLVETRPGLVPLTFAEQELVWMKPLSGLSLEGRVRHGRTEFAEGLLFTHRGLSGPAILQISSYWREGEAIAVDVSLGRDVAALLRQARADGPKLALRTALAGLVPERLARHLETVIAPAGPLGTLSNAALEQVAEVLRNWRLMPVGSEGYRTAEVTLGGVDTDALDARTLQAKGVAGLYFVGEVVDVTGWLGGYNFQWAWSSSWAAGQVV
ncbi:MAG: NAD(P)/FAD-dependent oxidoreductase [Pseudotabrizicola sp.]|uniref:NAD(P)/FAD-dependent oxidoreductase n=1 Tax=Pseudotabrizicola sp. TaxID=2939647 RepID=UPI002725BA30|nr:NAD(P)/FAD-dependent oxidoreductase [Pseudotabrizicola sp.]MDO9638598.1 NAD(P)/FAD-dependent oxidoreductase [Pseudotabrizicola sp.]